MQSFVFYLFAIFLIIHIRGDGYYPFPKTWPQDQLMLIVLFHTLLLVFFIFRFAYFLITGKQSRVYTIPEWKHLAAIGVFPIIALGAITGLHVLQAGYYKAAGYTGNAFVFAIFFILSLVPLLIYWAYSFKKKEFIPHYFLIAVLVSALIIKGIPLILFPIAAARSDLLPILKEGAISLFKGLNPYQYYLLDNGSFTQNVRLPGLMLAYLPAAVSGIDLRFISLFFEAATFLILIYYIKTFSKQGFHWWDLTWIITLFLLFPYWHYRHELYEAPFWFLLLLVFLALKRGNMWGFSIALGLMIGTHQWGWLFTPFLLVAVYRMKGIRPAVYSFIAVVVIGGALLALGIKSNFYEFYDHVFGFYNRVVQKGDFYPMSMYFSPYFSKFNITEWLRPLQAFLQIPILVLAYRYGEKIEAMAGILALSLTVMLLFSPVCWTYQYLLVIFLFILGMFFREGQ